MTDSSDEFFYNHFIDTLSDHSFDYDSSDVLMAADVLIHDQKKKSSLQDSRAR
jgi:hypothetical protein